MLPSKVVRNKAGRFVPVLLAGLILAACSGQAPQTPGANVQEPATKTSDYYLQQIQQSSDDNKADWQLLAIRALLNEGKYPQASQQLSQLSGKLSNSQQQELQLLKAQSALGSQDIAGGQAILDKLDPSGLSTDQQARYWQLQIAANQNRPSLTLLRALVAQEPLLQGDSHQKNIDATWQTLVQMTPDQMNSLVINANENVLQGWLDLLGVYNANRNDPDMLKAGISDWQTRYPNNPAAKTLPTALSQVQNYQQASTGKIALLLPMSGQAQIFASAIQKGFNDAKNGVLSAAPQPAAVPAADGASPAGSAQPTPTDGAGTAVTPSAGAATDASATPPANATPPVAAAASNAEVKVYDTSTQPLAQVLAQAQQDGATLVVGPLLKNNVEELAGSQTALNVLALNEPEQIQNRPNLCYFALSPEDEARDAAHHIWDQGKRAPLLLVPRGSLGDRISVAFTAEWQKLGGGTVLKQQFGSTSELKQGINSGAGISLSGTPVSAPQQAPQSVAVAGLTIPAPTVTAPPVASAGSVDATYIVSTQSELQLIKPMIAMRVSSRDNVALYASSRSSQAGAGPDYRLEMEGLQFSDIPLLTGANPALMQQAAKSFNNDYSLVRLYAMGIDAWTLANHFSEVRQLPGFQLEGNTGKLSATQDCVINRKLSWSQYRQGQIVPAT